MAELEDTRRSEDLRRTRLTRFANSSKIFEDGASLGDSHIAIIHRHGARYVCQEAFDLLKDTVIGERWIKAQVGKLSPVGEEQSRSFGRHLAKHVLKDSDDSKLLWWASSSDRVIISGRRVIQGMLQEGVPSMNDEHLHGYAYEHTLPKNLRVTGASSHLGEEDTHLLFRGFKVNPEYVGEVEQFWKSKTFAEKAESEQEFLEEIFKLLVPEKANAYTLVEKLKLVDALVGAIECERFMETQHLVTRLSEEQIAKIYALGRYIKDMTFFKLRAAKTLGSPLFKQIMRNSKMSGVALYSAHDHTICSLLARLGLPEYPVKGSQAVPFISFGAYLVLRIEKGKKVSSAEFNPSPFAYLDGKKTEMTTTYEHTLRIRNTLS